MDKTKERAIMEYWRLCKRLISEKDEERRLQTVAAITCVGVILEKSPSEIKEDIFAMVGDDEDDVVFRRESGAG